MKFYVFCFFVIANISNNGKASLESFAATSDLNSLTDTTKKLDKSCHRPCKFNVKPRRCYYYFDVEPSIQDGGLPELSINGLSPGPPIHVCVHDIIIVQVRNKIPDQDLAMHWHGMEQRGTPYMDGVPMITQCPISYGSTFKYAFKASSPGTFFYHADSVTHHSDGVYGTLIVDQPQHLEPHSSLYDYDRSQEHTIIVGARFPELLSANLDVSYQIPPSSLVINGHQSGNKLFVTPPYGYRLRLINAIGVECPIQISISDHLMTVLASDGKPVEPVTTRAAKLYPGERMDVVVRASQITGGYWLLVKGESACDHLKAHSMFIYSGFNYTSMLDVVPGNELYDISGVTNGQKLLSYRDVQPTDNIKSFYLGIDKNSIQIKDSDIDYRYTSDVLPKKPMYPSVLSLTDGVVQINGKNFLFPNAPLLLKPREVFDHIVCEVGAEAKHHDVQCLQTLRAPANEIIELVLVNEGFNSNDSYTFHMHGYGMHVVATWQSPAGLPLSRQEFEKLDKDGLIIRNLQNPPIKDTITVPNKGFTIVRINPDYGGTWLLECRSCSLKLPAAILISVPVSIRKAIVDSLPSCGSYKPADVLLN